MGQNKREPNPLNNNIFQQISWWKRLALAFPTTVLSFIVFLFTFGFDNYIDILLTIAMTIAVTISVMWWWWAMFTINEFSNMLMRAAKNLQEFKQDLDKIKKDL